jgi:acetolactate synthase-1/2/3 large subunit
VDVDQDELEKHYADLAVCAHAETFMRKVMLNEQFMHFPVIENWLTYCYRMAQKYSIHYEWVNDLPLEDYDIIVPGSSGVTLDELWLSVSLAPEQRMFSTMGLGAMGFAIPAAIGACLATDKPVLCIDGDGSFQLNIQELYTAGRLNLPIKFYYLNNGGYRSIQMTQDRYFGCWRRVGSEFDYPDIRKIAEVYGVDITEIVLFPTDERPPAYYSKLNADGTQSTAPLYDMYPPLDREEIERNML